MKSFPQNTKEQLDTSTWLLADPFFWIEGI